MNAEKVLTLLEKVGTSNEVLNKMKLAVLTAGAASVFADFLKNKNHEEIKELHDSVLNAHHQVDASEFYNVAIKMLKNFSKVYPEIPTFAERVERIERLHKREEVVEDICECLKFPFEDKARNDSARRAFLTEYFAELMS